MEFHSMRCTNCGDQAFASSECSTCEGLRAEIVGFERTLARVDMDRISRIKSRLLSTRAASTARDVFGGAAALAAMLVCAPFLRGAAGKVGAEIGKSMGVGTGAYGASSIVGGADAAYLNAYKEVASSLSAAKERLEARRQAYLRAQSDARATLQAESERLRRIEQARRLLEE